MSVRLLRLLRTQTGSFSYGQSYQIDLWIDIFNNNDDDDAMFLLRDKKTRLMAN